MKIFEKDDRKPQKIRAAYMIIDYNGIAITLLYSFLARRLINIIICKKTKTKLFIEMNAK